MAIPNFVPGTQIRASEMNTAFNAIYPVGSIYMSASLSTAEQVNAALPGTWEAWGAGRVPVGVDPNDTDFETAEQTGGEKAHTLTVNEMPNHYHEVRGNLRQEGNSGVQFRELGNESSTNAGRTEDAGGDEAHNNLQPYITCYMYKRIS